ncbi:unnamed protein product [Strongylus vulgaris]|uniref:Fucosyltransferase n=1 Tax=Strongylus vulgaris TaxID=40348 RepID=A0A3P7IKS4_STRVU|nr:unnamed protein product [Strongylus vulgaris]
MRNAPRVASLCTKEEEKGIVDIRLKLQNTLKTELGNLTDVTVRGRCERALSVNNKTRSASCKEDCSDDDLIATHRFYIAFENSNCNDYITEKFFYRVSQLLVPVVFKRRIYEDAGIPPHSFIAVDDYKSLKDLARYLDFLLKNDTEYLRYFEWTEHFRRPDKYESNALCKLCEDIYNGETVEVHDIKKYYEANQCI